MLLVIAATTFAVAYAANTASAAITWDGYGVAIADTTEHGDHLGIHFERLRSRTFRTMIAWNAPPLLIEQVANRINVARAAGATQILVSMDHDGSRSRPTAAAYQGSIEPIVQQLAPLVDYWGPVNEPNCVWLTGREADGAQRAAEYYLAMYAVKQLHDPTAGLMSPDFCDYYSGNSVAPYIDTYKAHGGGWGDATAWHPYWGIHRRDLTSTNQFSAAAIAAPGGAAANHPIWITESGGFISYPGRGITGTEDSQLADANWMIHTLGTVPQITRLYYYDMQAGNPTWDTALVDENARPRKAWYLWCQASHGGNAAASDCGLPPSPSVPDPPVPPALAPGVLSSDTGGQPAAVPATSSSTLRLRSRLTDALTTRRALAKRRARVRRTFERPVRSLVGRHQQWMHWSYQRP